MNWTKIGLFCNKKKKEKKDLKINSKQEGLECNFKNLRTNIKNELKFDNWKKLKVKQNKKHKKD